MPETTAHLQPPDHRKKTNGASILYLTTFPPRKCGIATFTQDVVNSMDEMLSPMITSRVAAMNIHDITGYRYPRKVAYQLNQDRPDDYVKLARRINRTGDIKLVNIQHEFGIFGGEWGEYLVPFCHTLTKPSVINFHTVMPEPVLKQKQVVRSLADNVRGITVMTDMSKRILVREYGIPSSRITIIPHGIHSRPFTSSRQAKTTLGFSDRVVLSTFGLLNRGKGLEYVIEALPEVVKRFPDFVYIYFGATHPTVLAEEGETYRNEIIERIFRLGLFDHVIPIRFPFLGQDRRVGGA
ncbi:MAG: glycosyltransferase, partial [Dehalococcoidia bacterium]